MQKICIQSLEKFTFLARTRTLNCLFGVRRFLQIARWQDGPQFSSGKHGENTLTEEERGKENRPNTEAFSGKPVLIKRTSGSEHLEIDFFNIIYIAALESVFTVPGTQAYPSLKTTAPGIPNVSQFSFHLFLSCPLHFLNPNT